MPLPLTCTEGWRESCAAPLEPERALLPIRTPRPHVRPEITLHAFRCAAYCPRKEPHISACLGGFPPLNVYRLFGFCAACRKPKSTCACRCNLPASRPTFPRRELLSSPLPLSQYVRPAQPTNVRIRGSVPPQARDSLGLRCQEAAHMVSLRSSMAGDHVCR